jgi:hypothetical protein
MHSADHSRFVVANARKNLVPLDGGPWLTAGPNRAGPRLILGGLAGAVIAVVLAETLRQIAWVLLAFVGLALALLGLLSCICIPIGRRENQVCPECLLPCGRGATTCPHCHFRPPQGGTV